MTIMNGTVADDVANAQTGALTGFAGTVQLLQDLAGDSFRGFAGVDLVLAAMALTAFRVAAAMTN